MPRKEIVEAVVRVVSRAAGPGNARRALDLSCGDGEILERLADLGWEVEGTHYRKDDYILKSPREILRTGRIHDGVDLTAPLPLADATYDLVLAPEVLEHLPKHLPLLREAGRVLKPGGLLVLTTPNLQRLNSRVQFFWTGRHNLLGGALGWEVANEALYSTHHNPVDFSILHGKLHLAGFRIETLGMTHVHLLSALLFFLYPFLVAATWCVTRRARRKHPEGGRDLVRWLNHPAMLLSEQHLVMARRETPSQGKSPAKQH